VPAVAERHLLGRAVSDSSAVIAERVAQARERQQRRFRGRAGVHANAMMEPADVRAHCRIDDAGEKLLRAAVRRLGLSARAFHRVLRLARTIADLARDDRIGAPHIAEAIQYRSCDRAHAPTR
jgi:magnesium chelatase family protein